jgi:Uma2 family endonuclease
MFQLPLGAYRSPDAAWILLERWEALSPEHRSAFPPLCPDFVVELRSASDNLRSVQDKMQEYLENSVRLGWLIDPKSQQVEIYRQGQAGSTSSPNSFVWGGCAAWVCAGFKSYSVMFYYQNY